MAWLKIVAGASGWENERGDVVMRNDFLVVAKHHGSKSKWCSPKRRQKLKIAVDFV
jgi:hypothetical protein